MHHLAGRRTSESVYLGSMRWRDWITFCVVLPLDERGGEVVREYYLVEEGLFRRDLLDYLLI